MRSWFAPAAEQLSPEDVDHALSAADLLQANLDQATTFRTATATYAHKHDLNTVDFQVLKAVVGAASVDRPATPSFLSRQLNLSASTLTSLLERLVQRGLLVRTRDSRDRRRVYLHYTPDAGRLVAEFFAHLFGAYHEMFADDSSETLAIGIEVLSRMAKANGQATLNIENSIPSPIADCDLSTMAGCRPS